MHRSSHRILGVSPFGRPHPELIEALGRAGATGILDLGRDREVALDALGVLSRRAVRFGVRIPEGIEPPPLPDGIELIVVERACPPGLDHPRVLVEVVSVEEAQAAGRAGAAGVIAKGMESGGRVGSVSAFVLLQQLVPILDLPVWLQGGIGLHTAGAALVGGAVGVVLDSQLALLAESGLPEEIRRAVAGMDGSETRVVQGYRIFERPDLPIEALAEGLPQTLGVGSLQERLLPAGQDAALAAPLAARSPRALELVRGLRREMIGHQGQAASVRPHAPGSAFARSLGLRYPIVQGPMTRVSDTPEFAEAVADAGALPFLALSLVRGEALERMVSGAAERLQGRPWGVGLLGFAPPDLREEQLAVVCRAKPPVALLAGGRPAQARQLEAEGIETYLHVPSPGLLDLFLRDGARRFVFEGRECGGHVGPRTSFVLWEQFVERLLRHDALDEISVLFAGGIHDARSAAMVSTLAAPLAVQGAKIGFLMGTAYLFTEEAVSTGAIQPGFQAAALACRQTVLLHTAPGHATRCADTAFVSLFEDARRRMQEAGASPEEIWEALERLNIGRLRIASKGIRREGDQLLAVDAQTQQREGMVMIGQVAALREQTTTLEQLHREVSEGPDALIQPPQPPEGVGVDVAIVGMAAVLPGALSIEEFWEEVVLGRDAVTEVPARRWNPGLYYTSDPDNADTGLSTSKWGGFLPEVEFDPLIYGIPPRSLASIEPVQLLALHVARAALDDAGYLSRPFDRQRSSVIFGAEAGTDLANAYGMRAQLPQYLGEVPEALDAVLPRLTEDSFPGVLGNVIAGRIANRLDLGGVNYTVDAACASSLAALDLAVKELAAGTSDLVIAGGADTHNAIGDYLLFSSVRALSPTGRSRPFDSSADGIALGEGVAAIVLKRYDDAIADGDRIYAVIKGIAGSSDGRSLGLTAPRVDGQALAMQRAYERAGISPSAVGLVEAHGTGTVVGDRTELTSLTEVFTRAGAAPGSVTLGSVKSNIGHTKCAAGLAGLIKSALSLYHGILPPSLHIVQPNPAWRPGISPFVFRSQAAPWTAGVRHAGVSAFGFGGTNFHVVLASHGDGPLAGLAGWPAELFLFRDPADVDVLLTWLEHDRPARLVDLAAAVARRGQGAVQLAIVAEDHDELRTKLIQARGGLRERGIFRAEATQGQIAFLFPGQGSQRPGMLADLFVAFPALKELLPEGWAERLYPGDAYGPAARRAQREALTDTRIAQPALGLVELAAARVLGWVGVVPDQLAGHSYGELVALCVAGALEPGELLALSEARGRAILDAADPDDPGAMAAISAGAREVERALEGETGVVVANHNSPEQTVIAGSSDAIARVVERFEAQSIEARPLAVAAAFHSPRVAAAQQNMVEALAPFVVRAPRRRTYANTTAAVYPSSADAVRENLAEHVVQPVRFRDQIEVMYADGARIFVEVGPGRALTGLVGQILEGRPHRALSLEDPRGGGALDGLVRLLAQLAVAGVPIESGPLFAGRTRHELELDRAPGGPSPTTWRVDGQRAIPTVGEPPEHGMVLVTEPVAVSLSGGDRREQVVLEYLRTLREQAAAQREVLLSFLGEVPDHLRSEAPFEASGASEASGVSGVSGVSGARSAGARSAGARSGALPGALDPAELLLGLVSERTGYPSEMLDLDLDLEADLSIDSIKRIEILGALAERLGQQPSQGFDEEQLVEALAGVKTLRGILEWIAEQQDHDLERLVTEEGVAGGEVPSHALRFVPELQPLQPPEPQTLHQLRLGLLSDGGPLSEALQQTASAQGARVCEVSGDEALEDLDVLVALTPSVVPGVASPENGSLGPALFELADLARRALSQGVSCLVVVTGQGGHLGQLLGDTTPVFGAGVSGLLKTVAKEWPLARVRRVDLDPADDPAVQVRQLLPELLDADGPTEVGYHGGRRVSRRFALHELPAAPLEPAGVLSPDAVVLLTGGARGITARVARQLAQRFGCTLVLVGRSPEPPIAEDPAYATATTAAEVRARVLAAGQFGSPAEVEAVVRRILAEREARATLADIRATGAAVRYRSLDIRDEGAVASLIEEIYRDLGRLDVVLHGAGVNEDKLLRDKSRESFLRVFETKVTGAHNLVRCLRDDTSAVVFFSSVAGAFGNRGQADYAAANDVLDQLARTTRMPGQGGRVFSINWGPWSGGGMVTPELEAQYLKRGIGLI
ncbi:MAG TPA: SDR family NAD(P)-dependent oxidoreductase, partial [Deltaproteobacteria bacterium]|nr:SDR family NAD(P)-dependent oxidoreductase [Deltaproteobacteria bacterium]